ncbi:MAG: TetR family transcriptional regulator [Acidimicrobiales bacterium]|nr:TetR family transcriptional regulator [Acidimicrobiales bacterium]
MPNDTGRRERKKAATRAALVDAALVLFAEQGVDETSIEQITDRVDVSVRTFHRYFASKDDVLFADREARLAELDEALRARPTDEPLLKSLREAAAQVSASFTTSPEHEGLRLAIIDSSETLRAVSLRATEEWARVVTEYASERLHLPVTDPLPRMIGSIVVIAVRHARRDWQADPSIDLVAAVRRNVDALADLNAAVDGEERP